MTIRLAPAQLVETSLVSTDFEASGVFQDANDAAGDAPASAESGSSGGAVDALAAPDFAALATAASSHLLTGGAGADTLIAGDGLTLTDAQKTIYRLYGATLGREPDVPGLNGWVGLLNGGMTLEAIAAGFVVSAEFQAT